MKIFSTASVLDPGLILKQVDDEFTKVWGAIGSGGGAGGAGPAGPQGPVGDQGPIGQQGPPGIPGVQGPPGPQGSAGAQGGLGPQAPAIPGPAGPAGPVGPVGPQGAPGPAGADGAAGAQGVQGAPGTTATIIGDFSNRGIAELPPSGSIPQDWDSPGNPPAAQQMLNGQGLLHTPTQEVCLWVGTTITPSGWVELGNVQGPAGSQGVPGPAGIDGAQGLQGPTGADGAQGPAGSAGAPGPQGPQGGIGPQGLQGGIGLQGPKGDQGLQGAKGDIGAQGSTGSQGNTGLPGAAGPQGAVGPAGPTSVSTDAANLARLGGDNLLFVPDAPSDGSYYGRLNAAWAKVVGLVGGTMLGVLNLKGTVAADQAAAGVVGENLATSQTTAVSLTTAVTANIATLTLTPGDWSVSGVVIFNPAQAPSALAAAISTASATLPTAAQVATGIGNMTQYRLTFANGLTQTMQTGICRINVSANTSVFLTAQGTFNSTCTATGYISARRVR